MYYMDFNLKKSKMHNAILAEKIFPNVLIFSFLIISGLFLIIFLSSSIKASVYLNDFELRKSVGFLLFFFNIFLITLIIHLFKIYLKNQRVQINFEEFLKIKNKEENINLADFLTFDAAFILDKVSKFKNRDLIIAALLLEIIQLKRNEFIFARLLINLKDLKKYFKDYISKIKRSHYLEISNPKDVIIEILDLSIKSAAIENHQAIFWTDLLYSCAVLSKQFQDIFSYHSINNDDLLKVISWEEMLYNQKKQKRKFWRLENLMRYEGIGKKWAYGYTITLDRFSRDFSTILKRERAPYHLVGHEDEVFSIEQILAKRGENNVLVLGMPGVGRKRVVLELAKHVKEGQTFKSLNYKRVLELDMLSIISGLANYSEFAYRLNTILNEALNAGNIILIIDDIYDFIGQDKKFDISEIILPYLRSPNFQLVAISDWENYYKTIEKNPAVNNLFTKIEIKEPSIKETMLILEQLLEIIERQYKVVVPYQAIKEIMNVCSNVILNIPFPKKAIDLLNELIIYVASTTGEKIILPKYIGALVYKKTGVPIFEAGEIEKEKLLNLENLLHKRIINQDEAIIAISNAMRRARANISERKKPIGTFLFLGPTGVGKTETAKALTEIYFGNEENMIRVDMSEYQKISSIDRLIGSASQNIEGEFANKVRANPFSLILFDEIEKAHKNILNLFLQVLDEGFLTDGFNKKVSFMNSIIISTSNAGSEFIREQIKGGVGLKTLKDRLVDFLLRTEIFKPEFLNRFDAVIVFQPLTQMHLKKIANLMLQKLQTHLKERGYNFIITPELIEKLAKVGFNPTFGAREMKRVIQDKIEGQIAERLLKGKYKKGGDIIIDPKDL